MAIPVKDIVHKLLEQRNVDTVRLKLITRWHEIIGNDLARYVKLDSVHKETLVLMVSSASWLQEMYHLTPTLLTMINTHLGADDQIKKLRFKQGMPQKAYVSKGPISNPVKAIAGVILTTSEKNKLATIKDEDIRRSVEKIFKRARIIGV